MLNSFIAILGVVSSVAVLLAWKLLHRATNPSGLPLPPGPPGIPLLGNVLDINTAEPWLTYTEWREKYGEIVYSQLLGQPYIVINSTRVARALLDQRSAKYSGRPALAIYKLFSVDCMTGLLGYTDELRLHRKLFHQTLRAEAAAKYQALYLRKARELPERSDQTPLLFFRFAASVIMAVTYGYETLPQDDPYVTRVQELINIITTVALPERAALLAAFPFLARLPAWFPGLSFKGLAPHCRQLMNQVKDIPFEYTRKALAAGTAPPSMVAGFLQNQMEHAENTSGHQADLERSMKDTAASVFIGGAETTSSTLLTFILALVLYPRVQERACAEIDAVLGSARLPTFDDRSSLPYVEAVLREVLRWHNGVPLGLPHATTASDTFEGYYIPKDAIVIFNAWGMSHSSSDPDDDTRFNPDRHFLPDGKLSPHTAFTADPAFGFGRRICPGRFFADGSAWAAIVTILSVLRIAKAKDAEGKEIEVKPEFTTGSAVRPVPFRCAVMGRSAEREMCLQMGL
ncbi:cytochrome P450 [Leucogyrophana mollusca]|uniref:Cytochrome P450 n=1 Tax=Leucogyrophana mollusca TaxID=85980 RepID=A0ACB8BEA9_9AGAM|nr:cytochrome P450 [Leucogyrophana mollusca]